MVEMLERMFASGSLESRYLQAIMYLDQVENLSNSLMDNNMIEPELVLALAQIKQKYIEEFARNNKQYTLPSIENAVKDFK